MIKVKLYELDKHRNETTFRPYLMAANLFREVGIEFTNKDDYDFAWIGQASYLNKKVSLEQSVEDGLEFLSKVTGDYFLFDGQDAATLIGSYEVLKESNALYLLKNTLYKDRSVYKQGWINGRSYWGPGEYKCEDFDKHSDRVILSGTNWLSTVKPMWYDYHTPKQNDLSALFSYPSKADVYEHEMHQSKAYDDFRKPCIEQVNKLPHRVAKLKDGVKLSPEDYYNTMYNSKIVLAPFGYGEMAPRDVEAVMFGSILLKPDMSHLESAPMWYEDGKTYISCKHDFSDLEEKVDYILSNYNRLQGPMTEYARDRFQELYSPVNAVTHIYEIFKTLSTVQ